MNQATTIICWGGGGDKEVGGQIKILQELAIDISLSLCYKGTSSGVVGKGAYRATLIQIECN